MENNEILGFQFEPTKALQPDSSSDESWETVQQIVNHAQLEETKHQVVLGACVSIVVNASKEGVLVLP